MHNRTLHIPETCPTQEPDQLHFCKAEPQVGVQLPRFFKMMLGQIEHGDTPSRLQYPESLGHCPIRVLRMMQRLAEERKVDRLILNRECLQIALAIIQVGHTMAARQS